MPISKAQAKRIMQSRKRFAAKKEEFLLKPIEPAKRAEMQYRNGLLKMVEKSKVATMNAYDKSGTLRGFENIMNDIFADMEWWEDFTHDIGSQIDEMSEIHQEAYYDTLTTATGINVASFINEQGLGELLNSMVEANMQEVTDLKLSMQDRVAQLVRNSLTGQEEKSPSLERQIRELFNGPTRNQARFIARDQTQRAVNGLNRFRQERSGIKKYKWRTSGDNRVRSTKGHNHKIMDGLEVEWETGKIVKTALSVKRGVAGKNVKNVAGGHVGQDYQCRCTASPILEI